MDDDVTATCPFCGITSSSELAIEYQIFDNHGENSQEVSSHGRHHSLPSSSRSDNVDNECRETANEANEWVKCTRANCGEYIHLSEIDRHVEFHDLTKAEEGEPSNNSNDHSLSKSTLQMGGQSSTLRSPKEDQEHDNIIEKHRRSQKSLMDYFSGNSLVGNSQRRTRQPPLPPGRLGKRELGPHAFEKEMPGHVRRHLLHDAEPQHVNRISPEGRIVRDIKINNETLNLIPALADLCARDTTTTATYFCEKNVKHICKIQCDGNFCGFWNIQMLISYIQSTTLRPDMEKMPNVLQIQETIEEAWKNGICPYGRTETGGIRGSRKWIGTHEVVAYFTQIGVSIDATGFRVGENDGHDGVATSLLDHVEAYFLSGSENTEPQGTSHMTRLPPIYFQRFGHSMTIVGLERKMDGTRNLLVFDPSFATAAAMHRFLDGRNPRVNSEFLLKQYRRSDVSLTKWDEFEIAV